MYAVMVYSRLLVDQHIVVVNARRVICYCSTAEVAALSEGTACPPALPPSVLFLPRSSPLPPPPPERDQYPLQPPPPPAHPLFLILHDAPRLYRTFVVIAAGLIPDTWYIVRRLRARGRSFGAALPPPAPSAGAARRTDVFFASQRRSSEKQARVAEWRLRRPSPAWPDRRPT